MIIELNLFGILLATLTGMLVGALWYSPLMFGNAWMKCLGQTPETLGSSTIPMIGSIFASVLTAIGVSILFSIANISDLNSSILIGAILGLLIIFPAFLSDSLFCGWGHKLLLIQSGYRVTSVFLMSLVMYFMS